MNLKAVIFDLDGTLYDNSHIARSLILRSLLNLRLLRSERICRREIAGEFFGSEGQTYMELFRRMALRSGRSVEAVSDWYWNTYLPLQVSELRFRRKRKPWVNGMLADLKSKGIRTACFSDYGMVPEKLEALGIDGSLFDSIADSPSSGGLKPCREAFLKVAEDLGVQPEGILVVGDRYDTDGKGAEAAGMKFMLVDRRDEKKIELKPDNYES